MSAYVLPGQPVDGRSGICSFMTIVLQSSKAIRCLCRLSLKLEDYQPSMLLTVSTALHCIYMAPKCLFYCLVGKFLTTVAELTANYMGRWDTRYCGKALEKIKVEKMMPRFFWHQQNSLLWTGIYILSVPRSLDCQGIWNGTSEAHKVVYKKKKKMGWNLGTLKLVFFFFLFFLPFFLPILT